MAAMTYRKAGVNIDEADLFIARIKPLVRSTARPEVMGTIGGFSGLFAPRLKGMRTASARARSTPTCPPRRARCASARR